MSTCSSAQTLLADGFDWRNVNGYNWNSPVKNQNGGTCWAFSGVGAAEARYKLTRNDPSFDFDGSEQQVEWDAKSYNWQGWGDGSVFYSVVHGLVSETEIPVDWSDSAHWDSPGENSPWPLSTGWQGRTMIGGNTTITSSDNHTIAGAAQITPTTANIKAMLKSNGPMMTGIAASSDMYDSVSDMVANYRAPGPGVDHAVVVVGYQDDASVPSGGYWIFKNSWDTGYASGGYGYSPYGDIEFHGDIVAISTSMYYSGAMYHTGPWDATGVDHTGVAATNTWKGATSSTWNTSSTTSGNWSNNETGQAFTWLNQELQAVFDGTGGNRAISVSGTVIAHGLTVSAPGYSFAPADANSALTITAGGVTTSDDLTFTAPVFIGGPQSWNVAAMKTLTVSSPLHTIISDLTFSGAGNTVISGPIDGGGVLNLVGGAKPGGLIQAGTGSVTISGTTNFSGNITAQSGAGILYIAPPGGGPATFDGGWFGGGTISINSSGTFTLGGGASNFTGTILWQQPVSLNFTPAEGIVSTFGGQISNNGSVRQNGPGTTVFANRSTNKNNYSGGTTISAGILKANDGNGLPTSSFLTLDGGILQNYGGSSTTFSRGLGTSGSAFEWTEKGGGFSAGTSQLTVSIGSASSPVALTWGNGVGSQIVGTLKLSSATATARTLFKNAIALGASDRTIEVADNTASTADYAEISGAITGAGGVVKTGDGLLKLTVSNNNNYGGTTTIGGGILQATIGSGIPSGSFLRLDSGVLQFNDTSSFTRGLGTSGGNSFQWAAGGGGFSAGANPLTVNVGNDGHALVWGTDAGTQIVGPLKLNVSTAQNSLTFMNGINLNGGARSLTAGANTVNLQGAISDGVGGASLTMTGPGTLYLNGSGNTYTGSTTIRGANVYLNKASGYAIPGDLYMGGDTPTYVYLQGSNQISNTAKLNWNVCSSYSEIQLEGHDLTVTGISNPTRTGAIQNTLFETGVANVTLTVNNSTDCSYWGTVRDTWAGSGTLALTKTGPGTLTLIGGGIQYSGPTIITGGKLVLRDITDAAFLARNITDNGTLELSCTNGDIKPNFSGVIGGSGALNKSGGATVTLSGASGNTYTGATTISDGAIVLAKTSGYAITGDFTIANANTFVVVQNPNQFPTTAKITFSGTGDPHFELYGNTVTVAGISGTGGGAIENTEGESGPSNGTLIVNNSTDCSYSSYLRDTAWGSGTLALVKSGIGKLTLGGQSSFSGPVTVNGGNLVGTNGNAFGTGSNSRTITVNAGGILTFARGDMYGGHTSTSVPTLAIAGGTVTNSGSGVHNALNNIIFNNGMLTSTTDAGSWATWQFNGTVTSTGTSTINYTGGNGQIMLQSGDQASPSTTFAVNGGRLSISNPILNGRLGSASDYSHATALVKTGAGTLILTGANSYTGATTISGGALQADASPSTTTQYGLPYNSYLKLDGGVLQSNSTGTVVFGRGLATSGVNKLGWTTNGGGFAAGAGPLTVQIGGGTSAVNWYDTTGANIAGVLKLNSTTATNVVTFRNSIYLNGKTRTVQVDDNPSVSTDGAVLSGVLSNNTGTGGLTKTGAGSLTLSGANTYTGLTTVAGGTLKLSKAAFDAVLNTTGTGRGADIQGGQLVFDYTGGADPVDTIRTNLRTSYVAGGSLLVSGPMFSSTAGSLGYGIGYADDAVGKTVIAKIALFGDSDMGGVVNFDDLGMVLGNYNQSGKHWADGDFNYDGSVTYDDLGLVLGNYNQTLPAGFSVSGAGLDSQAIAALGAAGIKVVPEPGTLALLAAGLIGLLAYAWKKRT